MYCIAVAAVCIPFFEPQPASILATLKVFSLRKKFKKLELKVLRKKTHINNPVVNHLSLIKDYFFKILTLAQLFLVYSHSKMRTAYLVHLCFLRHKSDMSCL